MNKLRIVIADDHEGLRRSLARLLSQEFEILDTVEHGMELIGAAITLNPDVIVSDVRMPRLTGPEAMDELDMRGLRIPFVFISSGENAIGSRALFVSKQDIFKNLVPAIHEAASQNVQSESESSCLPPSASAPVSIDHHSSQSCQNVTEYRAAAGSIHPKTV